MHNSKADVLAAIKDKGAIDDQVEAALRAAIEEFKNGFSA
jgi:F-type H+-transporting ATPase subunit alpha